MIFTGERADVLDIGGINSFRYLCLKQKVKDKKVIELGCAYGYGTYLLSKFGAKKIIAYDNDKKSLSYAEKKYKNKSISYIKADLESLRLAKKKFDVAVSFEVIEHLKNPKRFLKMVCSCLKDEGIFFVSTPNRYMSSYDGDKPSNPYHIKEYYPKEFRELLLRYFGKVDLYGIDLKPSKKSKENDVKKTLRWRLASLIVRKRIIRKIINYFPAWPKRLITGENKIRFIASDYQLIKKENDINESPYLFAVCRKI